MVSRRTFQVVTGDAGLGEIRSDWQELASNIARLGFYQTFAWYQGFFEHLANRSESCIVVLVKQVGKLEAIVPLEVSLEKRFGISVHILRAPRHEHMNLYDILLNSSFDNRYLFSDLLQFLKEHRDYRCDVLQFGRILEDSAALEMIREDSDLRYIGGMVGHCDYLEVTSEEDLFRRLSKNARANLRKSRKKLANFTNVEELSTRDPELILRFLDSFMEVEASGWKGAHGTGTAIALDPSLVRFYRHLAESLSLSANCEVNLLQINGKSVAAQFGIVLGDTLYLLKIGYDEEFASLAPGNLLVVRLLNRLFAEGTVKYVSLITDARWHASWKPSTYEIFSYSCYSGSIKARLSYMYLQYLRPLINRLRG